MKQRTTTADLLSTSDGKGNSLLQIKLKLNLVVLIYNKMCNKIDIKHLIIDKYTDINEYADTYYPNVTRIDCYNNKKIKGQFTSDNFPKLCYLDCSYTNITSIDKNTLEKLTYLNARNTKLSHLSKINECKIRELNIKNTNIKKLPECYDNILIKRYN